MTRCHYRGDGGCSGTLEAHHVIQKQTIRNELGRGSEIAEHATSDPRNIVTLCQRHHHRVTHGFDANPMVGSVWEFARDYGLDYVISRTNRRGKP